MTRKTHQSWCLCAVFCCLFGVFRGAAQVPYLTDFEGGIGPEWSLSNLETSATNSFTRFTGRFSNEAQTLTLTNLAPGQSYTVTFDLFIIDSWDGGGEPSGDFFDVRVYGNLIFHHTFNQFGGAQTYPAAPDVGPAPLGFSGGFNDSIFRALEVSFIATNATTTIAFQGQNLQSVADESWGIDNVQAQLTSALPPTLIQSTTLPAAGSTNAMALDRFAITASRDLLAGSATNASSYVLREGGVNGTLGDGDDNLYALVPAFAGGKTASFTFNNSPLQPGNYRLETKTNLLDKNSFSVSAFSRQFVITNPIYGRIESTSNDTLPLATPLPITETPPASGFFTALGLGTFSAIGEVDYWRFDAEAGDSVTIRLEADAVGVYPQLYLQNAGGQNQITAGGDFAGVVQIQNYRINSPGTYYLRVFSNNGTARYQVRVDQARNLQLETEANDVQGTANALDITASAGAYQAKVAGALVSSDAAGDYFRIGTLNPGNAISANLLLPGSSTLAVTNVTLTVELQGNGVALATNTTGSLNYTVVSNGVHYVRLQSPAHLNLRAQYLLSVNITDGIAPLITSLTFPSEGGVTSNIVDRVTLGFSEDVEAAFNGLNRSIRTFGTNAYLITDTAVNWSAAEAQAQSLGGHLVTINSSPENAFIRDTYSPFGTLWTGFTDQAVEGTFAWISGESVTFTNWNPGEPNNGGGGGNEDFTSFLTSGFWNDADGGNNYRGVIEVPGTDSDGDGLPNAVDPYPTDPLNAFDLRAAGIDGSFDTPDDPIYHFASYGYNGGLSASLRVVDGPLQPGNYRFTITASLRDRAGNALSAPFVRFFTVSGVSGFTVENRNNGSFAGATSLSVSPTNSSDGSFTGAGSVPVGSNPYFVLTGLLNADAHLDLITANNGSDNVSVLLGNGDGTFHPATNFAAGNGPIALALGAVNNDANADLVVANNAAGSVSVLLGNGSGTFGVSTNFSVGSGPRSVKLGDFNGDAKLDFVTANSGSANVSVALGNGDGSFGPRTNFAAASGPYGVAVA
ncbi:MAG TPA: FG-GAP-like repeat-containing protein, partial [Verrucomicrobiae bacterium]|nr:FG-GAP-like repeat-containing protein [Verrucomicrobiae bacterium]